MKSRGWYGKGNVKIAVVKWKKVLKKREE